MFEKKVLIIAVAGALIVGLGGGYLLFGGGGNGNIVVQPAAQMQSSSSQAAVPQKSSCDGPRAINLDDIYLKNSVTYRDASGTTKVYFDECVPAAAASDLGVQVSKNYCYESQFDSGEFVPGSVLYDCPFGCSGGACKKLEASSEFSSPYPVSWNESGVDLDLTGVSAGEIQTGVDSGLIDDRGAPYPSSSTVYALVLHLKISNHKSFDIAAPLNIRMLLNEAGDLAQPNISQFRFPNTGGNSISANSTVGDQTVTFVISDTQKQFEITTGGQSNIFFSVTIQDDGIITVKKEPTSEQG